MSSGKCHILMVDYQINLIQLGFIVTTPFNSVDRAVNSPSESYNPLAQKGIPEILRQKVQPVKAWRFRVLCFAGVDRHVFMHFCICKISNFSNNVNVIYQFTYKGTIAESIAATMFDYEKCNLIRMKMQLVEPKEIKILDSVSNCLLNRSFLITLVLIN